MNNKYKQSFKNKVSCTPSYYEFTNGDCFLISGQSTRLNSRQIESIRGVLRKKIGTPFFKIFINPNQ